MSELIDALLSLARVGRAELQATQIDLTRLAATLTQDLASGSPERRVKVHIDGGMKAYADPQLLRIVLGNLLDNAWKFTMRASGPEVEVGQCKDSSLPTYFVRDNGAGFDPAYADKLFGAFERLHTENEFPGTGIGLAIVHRIVTRHSGRIWAESAPGQGATFFFTLPPSMH
jgi:light-regulated signal transduction histidine kinase (bacteriophytochrome)